MLVEHFPRLTTVALSYLAAFLLFSFLGPDFFDNLIRPFGIFGVLLAGMLYTYSFTASAGALLLISVSNDFSPGLIAVVGGVGSLISDLTIFKLIRNDLHREVARIGRAPLVKRIGASPVFKEKWFRDALGALILASPLPDEIAIAIIASAKIKEDAFLYLAFVADMVGIFVLVYSVQAVF